jgi:tetratricopeptide (TPR) repeat protein
MPPGIRKQLNSVAAETAVLTALLLWYQGTQSEMAALYHLALRFASEANDQQLGAVILGRLALRLQPQERIRLLREGGYGFHPRDASPMSRAFLEWVHADAAAALGQTSLCLNAFERIHEILAQNRGSDAPDRPGVAAVRPYLYLPSDIHGDLGGCLAFLGRTDEARTSLDLALASTEDSNHMRRAWFLLAKASTYIQDEEPEPAVRTTLDALACGRKLDAQPIVNEARRFSHDMDAWREVSVVAELRDELEALYGSS